MVFHATTNIKKYLVNHRRLSQYLPCSALEITNKEYQSFSTDMKHRGYELGRTRADNCSILKTHVAYHCGYLYPPHDCRQFSGVDVVQPGMHFILQQLYPSTRLAGKAGVSPSGAACE